MPPRRSPRGAQTDAAPKAAAAAKPESNSKRVTRKRARTPVPEPEDEEESKEASDDEANAEDDDGANDEEGEDDEEEEEDEGELLFSGRTDPKTGAWISGTLTFSNTKRVHYKGELKNGEKHGAGEMFLPDGSSLKGTFIDDEIRGLGTYTGADGSRIVGTYVAGGMLEGEVVEYDDAGNETFRGTYVDSERHGLGTATLPDGGQLVGQFVHGVFQGDANKYVYPRGLDQEASLRGRWRDGVMESAQFFLDDTLIDAHLTYTFDESTATRISSHPLLGDPYEQRCVYVKQSTTPDSGEGLFALRDLPANTIVTWYSGTRDKGYKAERRKWSENSNTISLIDDDPDAPDIDIDVSEAWSTTDKYCASLAHKCNHSFDPAKQNAKYDMALHPRFGLIKSIRTLRPVRKDDELYVDYGYSLKTDPKTGTLKGNAGGPDWYRKAYMAHHAATHHAAADSSSTESTSSRPKKRGKTKA